jgi:hypothetical protein
MKTRMRASVKEVQKVSADAKKAVGIAGGPSYGAAGKRSMSSRRGRKERKKSLTRRASKGHRVLSGYATL